MAFHVPFDHRHPAPTQGPIYIGFDQPTARPRRKFNWWGFHGMWMSFASFLTAGFLSPIPLLISLAGLRRPGRKMAAVGTLTSLAGIGLASALVFGAVAAQKHHRHNQRAAQQQQRLHKQVAQTQSLIGAASEELTQYRNHHSGVLPSDIDSNLLVIKHVDPWGESLRFDSEVGHGVVRSAGPDKRFNTADDITSKVSGKTDREALLEVN